MVHEAAAGVRKVEAHNNERRTVNMTHTLAIEKARKEFATVLASNLKSIESILPKHMDAGRLCRMSLNALMKNPALAECTKDSFLMSVLNCGEMGLEPSLGQAALVPYKRQVQCQPMYQGLIDLARRSGQISTIYAEVVRDSDKFQYELGLDPVLKHTPDPEKAGELMYVYAVAKLKDGSGQFVVLTKAEVEKVRNASPAAKAKESPWNTWPEEMWKKTAIKRLCKFLPKSTELMKAIELDNRAESGRPQPPTSSNVPDGIDLGAFADGSDGGAASLQKPQRKGAAKQSPNEQPPEATAEEDPEALLNEVAALEADLPRGPIHRARKAMDIGDDVTLETLSTDQLKELRSLYRAV